MKNEIYVVWELETCGSNSGCKKGMNCNNSLNKRTYFISNKEKDKYLKDKYLKDSLKDLSYDTNPYTHIQLIEPNIFNDDITIIPEKFYVVWNVTTNDNENLCLNFFISKDSANYELSNINYRIDTAGIDEISIEELRNFKFISFK